MILDIGLRHGNMTLLSTTVDTNNPEECHLLADLVLQKVMAALNGPSPSFKGGGDQDVLMIFRDHATFT